MGQRHDRNHAAAGRLIVCNYLGGFMRLFLFLLLSASLAGCNVVSGLTDGIRHAQEVAVDLEKSVGSKPGVGFKWDNGSLIYVTVNFNDIPADMTTERIARLSRQSIIDHFKQSPKKIVISFVVPGDSDG